MYAPCSGCKPSGSGLGAWADGAEVAQVVEIETVQSGTAWWEAPLQTITTAVAGRIGGSTSPYSPGTYNYGDPGFNYTPPPVQVAPAPAPAFGISPVQGLAIAGVALVALKVAGVF